MGVDIGFRVVLLVVFGLGMTASGVLRRRADRIGGAVPRSADGRAMQVWLLAAAVVFYGSVLAWLIHPPAVAWARVAIPAGVRWSGAVLLAAGIGTAVWALWHLGRNVTPTAAVRPDAELVTSGPYRRVRHPLYASGLFIFPGSVLLTANLLVLVGGVAGFAAILVRLRREERELVAKFGERYLRYMERTGRILPRWSVGG